MRSLYDHYLKQYPELMIQNAISFDCGWGWKSILDKLMADALRCHATIAQVKEKFGTLRFYYDHGDEIFDKLVHDCEIESSKTCECCGTTQNVTAEGSWVKTLCAECHKNKCWEKHAQE